MRFLLALLLLACTAARADEFRPAYLELRELDVETWQLTWKVPARDGDRRLSLHLALPPGSVDLVTPQASFIGASHLEYRRVRHAGGLAGQTIRVEGLRESGAEVLVRVVLADGAIQMTRLGPTSPAFVVEAAASTGLVAKTYVLLGMEHILVGIDHLLFVLALLIIVRGGMRIVVTVTAFTVAHSLTLAAATLGWLTLPPPPVEAAIALSIVFLAREIVMTWRGRPGVTERAPWVVAFAFGLLHGLGFAGALAEIGLPQQSIPLALLCFNVGVELGQLIFVAAVLLLGLALRRWLPHSPPWLRWVVPYAIGGIAALWTVQRVAAFWV